MGKGMNSYSTQLAYADVTGKALDPTDFKRVIRIKDYGDLMGAPESLETTDLEDAMTTNTQGIKQSDALEFTYNYTKANYTAAKKLEDGKEHAFALHFNGTFASTAADAAVTAEGSDGVFYFLGTLSVGISGAGVNEVREGTITISQSTEVYGCDPVTTEGTGALGALNAAQGWSKG